MRLIPLGERILVELEDISNRKVGLIEIPDTAGEAMRCAKVIAVGNANGQFHEGDRVLFHRMSGVNMHAPALGIVDDNRLRFLMESEVIAKVEE